MTGAGCEGTARLRFQMPPASRTLGFAQPGSAICATAASQPLPRIEANTLLSIRTLALAPPWDGGINYGCSGCVYGADGRPGTMADATFPFPGLSEYSLVLRIGSALFQGGSDVRFVAQSAGTLEFCLNDPDGDAGNNRGGFEIVISADQFGPR